MGDSIGKFPKTGFPIVAPDDDPVHAIARRLSPLVCGDRDFWDAAARSWASNPPLHYVPSGLPRFKTSELMEELCRQSSLEARRGDGEDDSCWEKRRALIEDLRDSAKKQLAELKDLKDGCEVRDQHSYRPLPIPFTDIRLAENERLALLAAIHDKYATADSRIDPWPNFEWENLSNEEKDAAMRWTGLRRRVPLLRDHWLTHETTIELFVADVEKLFNNQCNAEGKNAHEFVEPIALTKEAAETLQYLARRHPVLSSLDDIEDGAKLSRMTAKKTRDELIDKNYANCPNGPKKGVVATPSGLALAAKISTKLVQT